MLTPNQILTERRKVDEERRNISQSALTRGGTTPQEKARLRALSSVATRLENLERRAQAGERIPLSRLQTERDLISKFERQRAISIEKGRIQAKQREAKKKAERERQRRKVATGDAIRKGISIVSDVSRSGKVTPKQREQFKKLGLDTRTLSRAAITKPNLASIRRVEEVIPLTQAQVNLKKAKDAFNKFVGEPVEKKIKEEIKRVSDIKRGVGKIEPWTKDKKVKLSLGERARWYEDEARNRDGTINFSKPDALILTAFYGAVAGVADTFGAVLKPGQTLKGLGKAIVNPIDSFNAIKKDITTSPITALSELAGGVGATKGASAIIKAGLRTSKGASLMNKIVSKVDDLSTTKTTKIKSRIKELKDKGVNTRQRTPDATELRLLNEQLKIITADVSDLKKIKDIATRKVSKTNIVAQDKKLKDVAKVANRINKRIPAKKKLATQAQKLKALRKKVGKTKLKDTTISKKLGDFFKQDGKLKVRITKKLPADEKLLNDLFVQARKEGGQAFSRLKKKLKKERGLNVVERKKKGKIAYKFLEPKEQRKLGKLTRREKEFEYIVKEGKVTKIEINNIKKLKVDIDNFAKKDLSNKQLDNLEKQISREIKRSKKTKSKSLFSNKKAQLQFKKGYRRQRKTFKNKVDDFKAIKRTIKKDLRKIEVKIKNRVTKKRGKFISPEEARKLKTITRKVEEVVKTSRKIDSRIIALGNIVKLLLKKLNKADQANLNLATLAQGLKVDQGQLTSQLQDLRTIQKQANKLSKITIIKKGKLPRVPGKTIKKRTITKTPVKPPKKITKLPPGKPPRKPPSKPPKKPPVVKPKLPINFDSPKLKNKVLLVRATLRERKNPDKPFGPGNIRITKKSLKGTRNRIANKLNRLVDNKLIASWEPKVIGIGKNLKDVPLNKALAKKFTRKKSKGTGVKRRVEKSKFRLDTPGEKKKIQKLRKLKKKTSKKPTQAKKLKRKSQKKVKTPKKIKKSSKKRSKR